MKNCTCLLIFIFIISGCSCGQAINNALIIEVEDKLRTGNATTSQVLTNKKYDVLHPETSFRRLIEKYCKAEPISITTDTIQGRKIQVIGTIQNSDGSAIVNALVYLYHTDSRGWYAADAPHVSKNQGDMRHARLFGYVRTDKEGKFELHTIKPAGYPQSDLPAHIHVHVSADGYRPFVNEFLFDDDERLVGNIRAGAVRNQFMISKPEKADQPFEQKFTYIITLRE